ncbi:MAG: DMT family protein [Bacteroidota bacterium]
MRTVLTLVLLVISNVFMTMAWYGHLKWKSMSFLQHAGLFSLIVFSWAIAFFEYVFMVPANRLGSKETGGNLDLFQLKIIQEAISIVVFTVVVQLLFKGEAFHWKYALAFVLVLIAVWLVFTAK